MKQKKDGVQRHTNKYLFLCSVVIDMFHNTAGELRIKAYNYTVSLLGTPC